MLGLFLANYVFETAPFQVALVGFEIDMDEFSFDAIRQSGIPRHRFDGILLVEESKLVWYPPTAPIFSGRFLRVKK